MANGFLDALGRFGKGFGVGMASPQVQQNFFAQQQMERQQEAMNPIREAVLSELQGPRNTFAGAPSPGLDAGSPAQTQAAQPPAQVESLPSDIAPPPEIDNILRQVADQAGVPVNALRAIALQESSFNPGARNQPTPGDPTDPGATGLFQFTDETAQAMGIDPNDPVQSAMATAQMLRQEMERGSSLEEAMTAHFGGPNRENWGPKTQRYMQEVTEKFRRYEQETQRAQMAPAAPAEAPQGQTGPFGTQLQPEQPDQQGFGRRLLEEAARDPQAFAQMFADGGVEQIASMLQGGQGFTGTLSEGQVAFQGGQPVAAVPKSGGQATTRVVSGDTQEGQQLGIPSGERARVEYEVNEAGNVINRNVKGRFGSGQTIHVGPQGERLGVDVLNKEIETVAEAGRTAMGMLPALDRAGELLTEDVQTGLGQRMVLPIRQLAADFGVPLEETAELLGINLSDLSSQEEFRRLTTQVIIDGFSKFKGNLNAKEVQLAENAFANMGTSEEANRRAIAMTRAAAEEAIDRRNNILQARDQDGVSEALKWQEGSNEQLKARAEELFEQMKPAGGVSTERGGRTEPRNAGGGGQDSPVSITSDTDYDALPSGTTFIAPDGTTRRKP